MIIVNPGDEAFLTYDWYPHKFGLPVTIDHKSSWTYVQLSMEATRSDWTEDNELSGEAAPNYMISLVEAKSFYAGISKPLFICLMIGKHEAQSCELNYKPTEIYSTS